MKTRITETRSIRAGSLALAGMLVIGALTAWMLPADAEARYGGKGAEGWGSNQREPAANSRRAPEKVAPVYDDQPLSETEAEALLAALDDEYKAWATYEQVIDDFGAVQPFTSVQRAEENHIAALVAAPPELVGLALCRRKRPPLLLHGVHLSRHLLSHAPPSELSLQSKLATMRFFARYA